MAAGVDVGQRRRAIGLPTLPELDDGGRGRYEALLLELEVEHLDTGASFVDLTEGVAA